MMFVFKHTYIWIFLIEACSGEISILLNGVDIAKLQNDNIIKIIEGERLLLECTYEIGDTEVTWSRNNSIVTRNSRLELEHVRIEDEALYTCTVTAADSSTSNQNVEYQSVFVKILYPPSFPEIVFPNSVLAGEELSLTYNVYAEPEPTFQWRQIDPNGLLVSRNRTYHMVVPSVNMRLYCVIQSLMMPTLGEPRTTIVSPYVYINVHKKATITSVYPSRYIYKRNNEDLILECHANGYPAPILWWTKIGDKSFYVPGSKYTSYNIDASSAGTYACHAENIVVPANKTQMSVLKAEVLYVFVNGEVNPNSEINCTNCLAECTLNPNLQTQFSTISPNIVTDSESSKNANCSTEKDIVYTDKIKETNLENDITFVSLVVATATGWTVFLVTIGLNLYYFKKYKNTKLRNGGIPRSNSLTEGQTSNHSGDEGSSYVFNVRFPDNTYTDLTAYDQINSRNNSIIQPGRAIPQDLNDSGSVSTQTSVVTYLEPM